MWRLTSPRSLPPTRTWAGSPPPPPTASGQRQWAPLSSTRWSRAPRAPLAGALLQVGGGGGVGHPLTSGTLVLSNVHGCYFYIFVCEYMYMQVLPATPLPWHGHFERHMR